MYFTGIGNVTECNSSCIHLNNEGRQESIKATMEKLQEILKVSSENVGFYSRMYDEIYALYEKLKTEAEAHYKYITDEQIEEARKKGDSNWWHLSLVKDSHNEDCIRNISDAFGTYNGCKYASDREMEARKIKAQAENAIKELVHRNPNIKRA